MELRNQNKIVCTNTDKVNIEDCYDNYCIFDLENDPCETNNVIDKETKVFHDLRDILNNYKKQVIKFEKKIYDEHSHPKFWNNYWSPWINDTIENNKATNNWNKTHHIILVTVILFFNYKILTIFL